MNQKVVIAGSASLQEKVLQWRKFWTDHHYQILAYPEAIPADSFMTDYPKVFRHFFQQIESTDVFFLMNENKNGINGYIGAESFAELAFAVSQNQINNKHLEIIILQMPDPKVQSFQEINLWLQMGWIKLLSSN